MPTGAVFQALDDLTSYPYWWPDVRSVHQLEQDTAQVRCRALLPYSLELRMHRVEEDVRTGRLRVDLTGDLEGYCACRIQRNGHATRVDVVQEVHLRKTPLRKAERLLAPLYRANHAAMMWRGERGLRAYLVDGA